MLEQEGEKTVSKAGQFNGFFLLVFLHVRNVHTTCLLNALHFIFFFLFYLKLHEFTKWINEYTSCEWSHSFSLSLFSPLFWLWLWLRTTKYWIYPLQLAALRWYSVGQFDRVQRVTNAKCVMNFSVYFSLVSDQDNRRTWELGIRHRWKPTFLIGSAFHSILEHEYDNYCTSFFFSIHFARFCLSLFILFSSLFMFPSSMSHNVCIWYIFVNFSPFSRTFWFIFEWDFCFSSVHAKNRVKDITDRTAYN